MTVYNFPSDLGWTPTGSFTDPGPLNLGTKFALTATASITGIRFYLPSSTSTVTAQLYADGAKVAEKAGQSVVTGWNTILFDTPVSGTTGVLYMATALQPTGTALYTARSNSFTDGTTAVTVTVGPASIAVTDNGQYTYSTGIPSAGPGASGPWYGVDAIIDNLVVGPGAVSAVRATATAASPAPVVAGTSPGVVTVVRAQGIAAGRTPVVSNGRTTATATATALAPSVDVIATQTGGGPAASTAIARPPTVSSTSVGSVAGARAQASADGQAPAVVVTQTVTGGGAATATGVARAPVVSVATTPGTVVGVVALATAVGRAPSVTVIAPTSVTVNAIRATATATSNPPGVTLVETLPSNVGTGRITLRAAEAKVLVGDADGIPNLYPMAGETVTFTSTAPILLDTTATPAPVVIIPRPIVCTLDSLGYLVDSAGHQYVDLIATNDPDLTPTTRKWRAVFSAGLGIATFDFTVIAGTTKDLTAEIPT